MATVLDELLVKLGFDADVTSAERFNDSIEKISTTAGRVGKALAAMGAVAGAAIAKSVIDTSNYIDESARLAGVANVTTQELQKMTAGAERFGISQEKLADILKDVNDKVGDFAQTGGGAMADFFEQIGPKVGVTAEHFENLSGSDALQLYVDSLERANVSQADMVFYMEAIASDSTMLLPLLEKGGEGFRKWGEEAQRAGKVSSLEQIAAAETLRDNMQKARALLSGFNNRLGARVTPYFNIALEKLIDSGDEINAIADSVSDVFEGVVSLSSRAVSGFGELINYLFELWDSALYARNAFNELASRFGAAEASSFALAGGIALVAANIGILASAKIIAGVKSVASAILMIANPVAVAVAGLMLLGLVIQDIYGYSQGRDSVIGGLIDEYPALQSVVDIALSLIDVVKRIWTDNEDTFRELFDAIMGLVDAFKPLILLLIDILPPLFSFLLDVAVLAIEGISLAVSTLAKFFTGFVKLLTAIWKGLWPVLSSIFEVFFDIVMNRVKAIVEAIRSVVKGLHSIVNGDIISGFATIGDGVIKGVGGVITGSSGGYSGKNAVNNNNVSSYQNQSNITQHINVKSAQEASLIASRTAQSTRQLNMGYM